MDADLRQHDESLMGEAGMTACIYHCNPQYFYRLNEKLMNFPL